MRRPSPVLPGVDLSEEKEVFDVFAAVRAESLLDLLCIIITTSRVDGERAMYDN